MELQTLKAYLLARGWSQSDLARAVGLSRQAVSKWFRHEGAAGVRGSHLAGIGRALDVSLDSLMQPLPCLGENEDALRAHLLWDRLYEGLTEFAVALIGWEPRAVGRLVEVYGVYAAAKILGPSVWKRFGEYSRFIAPKRRGDLQTLVQWKCNQVAN